MKHALPAPDFLRPVARPGALAWVWCATGLLVLAAAGLEARTAWQRRAQALADVAALDARANPIRPALRPAAAAPASSALSAEARRQAEAAAWLQRLALPWPAVWAGIDSASEQAAQAGGIAWLTLSHGDSGTLRLVGQASSLGAVDAAAQALRARQHHGAALWRTVTVAGIDRVPEGVRVEIVAQLGMSPATTTGAAP